MPRRSRRSVLADEAERQGLNTTYTTTAASSQQLENTGRRIPISIPENAVTPAPGLFVTPAAGRTGIPRRHLEMSAGISVRSSMSDLRYVPQSARSTASGRSQMQRTLSLLDLQQSQQSQRSPGTSLYSSRTGGGDATGPLVTGHCYYPDHTDRETLTNMAKKIVEVLAKTNFKNRTGSNFTTEGIRRINSKDFNGLCIAILGKLCYPYENRDKGNDKDKPAANQSQTTEELKFIRDMLQKLGFPLTFNVTQLVTIKPNCPMVLTILSFLCCIYEELMEVETERNERSFLQQAELLLIRSVTNLFGACYDGIDMATNLPHQLDCFKVQLGTLAEATDVLDGKTLDEVKELIEEKNKELTQLLAVPDPGQDLRQKITVQKEHIETLKQRLVEIRRTRGNLQDPRSLEQERETLVLELRASERQLEEVSKELARQNVTPKELEKLNEKLRATEQQIETLKNLLEQSALEKKKKEEFVNNDQQRCYEEIASLKIVDAYNREAGKLTRHSIPKFDANPVDLDELDPWLKQVTAKGRFVEEQVERSCADMKTTMQSKTIQRNSVEMEVKRLKDLLDQERTPHQTDSCSIEDVIEKQKLLEKKKKIIHGILGKLETDKATQDEKYKDVLERYEIAKADLEKVDKLAAEAADEVEFQESLLHSTVVQRMGELMAAIKEDLEKWKKPFDYDKMVEEVTAEVHAMMKKEKEEREKKKKDKRSKKKNANAPSTPKKEEEDKEKDTKSSKNKNPNAPSTSTSGHK